MIPHALLGPLEDLFRAALDFFHGTVGLPWAWAIVALTVVVRTIMLPITARQLKSARAMQAYAPQMKALQTRYKGDRERLSSEMMKFYKEAGVNPLASCLPILFQIPVFIGLFYTLQALSRELQRGELSGRVDFLFGFLSNITEKTTEQMPGSIILLAIYVVSQLVSTELVATPQMDKTQRMIFRLLPFFFVPFVLNFPVGLLLYWTTSNLWTVGQGVILRKMYPVPEPKQIVDLDGKAPKKAKTASGGGSDGPRVRELPKRTPPKRAGAAATPVAPESTANGASARRTGRAAVPPKRSSANPRPAGQRAAKGKSS